MEELDRLINECPDDCVVLDDPNFNGEYEVVSRFNIEEEDFDWRRLAHDPLRNDK